MNVRALAVVALVAVPTLVQAECGWLLMAPPANPKTSMPMSSAPLADWIQVSASDSAETCESKKFELTKEAGKFGTQALAATFMSSRCLPASQVPVR